MVARKESARHFILPYSLGIHYQCSSFPDMADSDIIGPDAEPAGGLKDTPRNGGL